MRNGQNKHHRMRGRNRGGKSHNPLTRVYESNGPDVKIRGTANHVAEKYIQLARDATASGDPVAAENYYQHAEHYFRLIAAAQDQFRQTQPFQQRESNDEGFDGDDDSQPNFEPHSPREQSYQQQQPREAQPYQPREQREQREQPYQPREQREQRDQSSQRDYQPRQERQPRQDRQPYQDNRPTHQANGTQDDDVERLPSFITGGAAAGAPQAAADQEQQGDRFPLHRRRRRPRGPRPDMAEGGSDDSPGQTPPGE
jgi:hypothetical protein